MDALFPPHVDDFSVVLTPSSDNTLRSALLTLQFAPLLQEFLPSTAVARKLHQQCTHVTRASLLVTRALLLVTVARSYYIYIMLSFP